MEKHINVIIDNNTKMDALLSISPCDGRYAKYTKVCQYYFSEYAIQSKRLHIEVLYLQELLSMLPELACINNRTNMEKISDIYKNFNLEECKKIQEIEMKVNHDVKAVELYIRDKLIECGLDKCVNYIHFGLTSQDINNITYPVLIKEFITTVYKAQINVIRDKLENMYTTYNTTIMLSHTHGQAGVPTSFGKEMKVFEYRLGELIGELDEIKYKCKFGGATGNFNAHVVAYPEYDWKGFADKFVESFGCSRSQYTTQIANYEDISKILDIVKRINTVLIDLCQDIWLYIFKDYLQLSVKKEEVGSSTMPHKVNPINFENAEGNLGISNCLFEFISRKLPVSRLQRDLTDSTVLRNLGMSFGYSIVALNNIQNGLDKITPNTSEISKDLQKHVVVLSEAYQTVLRKYGIDNAYDKLKEFTRVNASGEITIEDMHTFINNLDIDNTVKTELYNISVTNYTGIL